MINSIIFLTLFPFILPWPKHCSLALPLGALCVVPATSVSCKQSFKTCQHLVQNTALITLHIRYTQCASYSLHPSICWVPSTSLDRLKHFHPCLVALPVSVLKTHFHCCCPKMKMPLRTARSVQPREEAATITRVTAKHTTYQNWAGWWT